METIRRRTPWTMLSVAAAVVSLMSIPAVAAAPGAEMRVSENAFHADGGRRQTTPDRVSTDAFEPGAATGKRSKNTLGREPQKSASIENSRTPNTDFWFYTADVELFADTDRDGYFHGIDLLFDADTYFANADVYAVVYLSLDGGPWLEYAETDIFTIFGATSEDEYVVVSELLAGYPTGSYDLLIELFDAWDDSFVADFGPESSSELALLPLEDAERDTPVAVPPAFVGSHGGGGAADPTGIAALAVLAFAALLRRRYRLRPVPAGLRDRVREPYA